MIEKQNIKIDEDGKVVSADITIIKKVSPEQFTQIYLQDNEEFFKLSKAESNVLAVCWHYSIYYEDDSDLLGNKVIYNTDLRDKIIEKTSLKEGTIKNTMGSLVKKKMLIKDLDHRGIYYLNPQYFFKGKISKRTQVINKYTQYQIK